MKPQDQKGLSPEFIERLDKLEALGLVWDEVNEKYMYGNFYISYLQLIKQNAQQFDIFYETAKRQIGYEIWNNATPSKQTIAPDLLEIEKRKYKIEEMRKAAEPLIKYLCENHHPHVTAIVTGTSIELLEGLMSIPKIYDFIKD